MMLWRQLIAQAFFASSIGGRRMVPPIMNFLGVFLVAAAPPQAADDPLLRPLASDHASQWLTPQPPTRIFGNTFLVGFGGLTGGLIHNSAGLILLHRTAPPAVPQIEDNSRGLGFELSEVK